MMKRLLHWWPAGLFLIGLLLGSVWAAPRPADARQCARTYRVQWGDTLFKIAAREGKSVDELAELNHLVNPHLIFAGTELCLAAVEAPSRLTLAAEYKFSAEAQEGEDDWTLGRDHRGGLRVDYPAQSEFHIHTFAGPLEVLDASEDQATEPLFWITRNANPNDLQPGESISYTLVVIGSSQPLLDLQLGFERPAEDIWDLPDNEELEEIIESGLEEDIPYQAVPVSATESITQVTEARLTAELVARDGTFVPVNISHVDYHKRPETARLRYGESVAFAVHPAGQGDYTLLMILNEDGVGPPGTGRPSACGGWRRGGWWSRFRFWWFGCR